MTEVRRALIVVDVQNEYVDGVLQIQYPPLDETVANIGRAMDVAVELDLPVVVLQHEAPRAHRSSRSAPTAGRCTPRSSVA